MLELGVCLTTGYGCLLVSLASQFPLDLRSSVPTQVSTFLSLILFVIFLDYCIRIRCLAYVFSVSLISIVSETICGSIVSLNCHLCPFCYTMIRTTSSYGCFRTCLAFGDKCPDVQCWFSLLGLFFVFGWCISPRAPCCVSCFQVTVMDRSYHLSSSFLIKLCTSLGQFSNFMAVDFGWYCLVCFVGLLDMFVNWAIVSDRKSVV